MSKKMIFQWIISAKVNGICKETGKDINIGDEIDFVIKHWLGNQTTVPSLNFEVIER